MALLFEIVIESIARTLLWVGLEAVVAAIAVAAVIGALKMAGRSGNWRLLSLCAIAGALAAAALVDRFALPSPLGIEIWDIHIPALWSLGGALAAAGIWALRPQRNTTAAG